MNNVFCFVFFSNAVLVSTLKGFHCVAKQVTSAVFLFCSRAREAAASFFPIVCCPLTSGPGIFPSRSPKKQKTLEVSSVGIRDKSRGTVWRCCCFHCSTIWPCFRFSLCVYGRFLYLPPRVLHPRRCSLAKFATLSYKCLCDGCVTDICRLYRTRFSHSCSSCQSHFICIFLADKLLSVNALLSLLQVWPCISHTPLCVSAAANVDMLVPIMTFVLYVFAKERFAL